MRKITYWVFLLVVLLALSGGIIACKSNPSSTPEESAVRAYADPATETTLQGLSENSLQALLNFVGFVAHGNND